MALLSSKISIDHLASAHSKTITAITTLINKTYSAAYSGRGIWAPTRLRTTVSQIEKYVNAGEMYCAYLEVGHSKIGIPQKQMVGVVRLHMISPRTAEFSLLAVDESVRGFGLGRVLVEGVEEESRYSGVEKMRLEVLGTVERATPNKGEGKRGLGCYYEKMGYRRAGSGDLGKVVGFENVELLRECEYAIFEKRL